jgi:hypothetical protein
MRGRSGDGDKDVDKTGSTEYVYCLPHRRDMRGTVPLDKRTARMYYFRTFLEGIVL